MHIYIYIHKATHVFYNYVNTYISHHFSQSLISLTNTGIYFCANEVFIPFNEKINKNKNNLMKSNEMLLI